MLPKYWSLDPNSSTVFTALVIVQQFRACKTQIAVTWFEACNFNANYSKLLQIPEKQTSQQKNNWLVSQGDFKPNSLFR